MRVQVKGVKRYKDRHGTLRLYHRKSGTAIDATLSGAEIAAEVARLDKLHAPAAPKSGTLAGLLESYKKAPPFTDLATRTKSDYQKCMDYLQPIAGTPLHLMDTAFMAKLRDKAIKAKRAGFTNHMMAMLSSAFRHGAEYGLVEKNPVTGLAKAKMAADRKRENRPWSLPERDNVLAVAPDHLRLPLALARYLGMRRGDILKLPQSAYKNGFLSFRTSKTGKTMKLPVVGKLRTILDAAIAVAPQGDAVMLCLNSYGEGWSDAGFTASQRKFFAKCIERGIADPGITLHGLRHSVATDLRALGYSLDQIKDYVGHENWKMTEHYASNADANGVLIDMANLLQGGTSRERKLSNRSRKSV
ncbi:tyrosine-type recombinase/integrase [Pelagibacterium luteolum]|uniref:Site-specific recombinase XerD n=1 Tax=Pelagibacterium luteolum TaxID=440168 RepID=A0A1G7ZGN9_9HYPH|nr:tyrosine-type recombinase/integrase [Pelagibacterium luteolum]SDH07903.1 Site-specific recombinase XerD [Pelagibacterium luteolum]